MFLIKFTSLFLLCNFADTQGLRYFLNTFLAPTLYFVISFVNIHVLLWHTSFFIPCYQKPHIYFTVYSCCVLIVPCNAVILCSSSQCIMSSFLGDLTQPIWDVLSFYAVRLIDYLMKVQRTEAKKIILLIVSHKCFVWFRHFIFLGQKLISHSWR